MHIVEAFRLDIYALIMGAKDIANKVKVILLHHKQNVPTPFVLVSYFGADTYCPSYYDIDFSVSLFAPYRPDLLEIMQSIKVQIENIAYTKSYVKGIKQTKLEHCCSNDLVTNKFTAHYKANISSIKE